MMRRKGDSIQHIYINEYVVVVVHEFLAREKVCSCEYLAVLWKSPERERKSLLPMLITSFLEQSEVAFREAGTVFVASLLAKPSPLLDTCVWDTVLSNSVCNPPHNRADYILAVW